MIGRVNVKSGDPEWSASRFEHTVICRKPLSVVLTRAALEDRHFPLLAHLFDGGKPRHILVGLVVVSGARRSWDRPDRSPGRRSDRTDPVTANLTVCRAMFSTLNQAWKINAKSMMPNRMTSRIGSASANSSSACEALPLP